MVNVSNALTIRIAARGKSVSVTSASRSQRVRQMVIVLPDRAVERSAVWKHRLRSFVPARWTKSARRINGVSRDAVRR